MLEKPDFYFKVRRDDGLSANGAEYIAIGLEIKEERGERSYRLTLPIHPAMPVSSSNEDLIAAGMESLRYLCANLSKADWSA